MNLCFFLFCQKRREGRKNSNKRDTGREKKMVNPLILFLKEDREKKRDTGPKKKMVKPLFLFLKEDREKIKIEQVNYN